jgi:hypothetical protein
LEVLKGVKLRNPFWPEEENPKNRSVKINKKNIK